MTGRFHGWDWAAAALLCVAAAGCQQQVSRDASAGADAPVTAAPAAAAPAAAGGDSPGKPLPPIDFSYAIVGTPALGQPLEIRLTSRAGAFPEALDALNVALSGDERLQLPADAARLRMARAAAGEPMTRTVRVTPLTPGTHYLNVLLEADVGGRIQSRSVTIPIRVGADGAGAAPAGETSIDAAGEPIISLPASDSPR